MSVTHVFFHPRSLSSTLPSPLFPRDLNAPPPKLFHLDNMSASKPLVSPPSPPVTPPSHAQQHPRAFQSSSSRQSAILGPRRRPSGNPLIKTDEQSRTERREEYLSRVQQRREEDRWNVRGDQILQLDYIAQQRAWEAQLAEAAPALDPEWDDDVENEKASQAAALSSSDHQDASQYPWFRPPSQMTQPMDIRCSQQPAFSQPSQHQYGQYLQSNSRDENYLLNRPAPLFQNEDEVDAIIEAEERELEALVALHDLETPGTRHGSNDGQGTTQGDMWDQLPEIKHPEWTLPVGFGSSDNPSSPMWGSEDTEFEEELLRLTGDRMDLSGG